MDSAYFLFDGPASGAVTTVVAAGGTEEDLHSAEKVDVCGCSVPRRPCCPEGYYWKDLSCWQSKEVRYSHIIFTLLFVFSVVGLLCMFMFFGYLDEGFHGVSIPLSVSALLSIYTFVYAIQALVTLQHPEDYVDTDHMRTSDTCCNGMSCVATLCYLRLCGVVVPLYLLIELALCISLFLAMVVQQWFVPIPNYLIVLVLIAVVTVNVYIRR